MCSSFALWGCRLGVTIIPLLVTCNATWAQNATAGNAGTGNAPNPARSSQLVAALLQELTEVELQLHATEQQLPALRKRIEDLAERLDNVRVLEPKAPIAENGEKTDPREVEFQTPQLRESDKDTTIAFVCREERLFVNELTALVNAWNADSSSEKGRVLRLASGDFDARIDDLQIAGVQGNRLILTPQFEMVLKAGHAGMSLSDLSQADNKYRERLQGIDPKVSMLQFTVFPDGYDVFRQARAIAWERGFGLNWVPMAAGAKVLVSQGKARVMN